MNKKIKNNKTFSNFTTEYKNRAFFVLIDTNFIYFTLKNKIDLFEAFIKCLCSNCILCVSECVILELERLGPKFRLALRVLKAKGIIKLSCCHDSSIIYADDCIFQTVKTFRHFLVATCDKDLKRRIRKISFTPIISIKKRKLQVSVI